MRAHVDNVTRYAIATMLRRGWYHMLTMMLILMMLFSLLSVVTLILLSMVATFERDTALLMALRYVYATLLRYWRRYHYGLICLRCRC